MSGGETGAEAPPDEGGPGSHDPASDPAPPRPTGDGEANDRLRRRADRALGGQSISDAIPKVRAIVGVHVAPNSEPLAQAALDRLGRGEEPTPEQLVALEIVVRLLRPVVYSRGGRLDDLPDTEGRDLRPPDMVDAWSAFRARIEPFIGSIGRIELTRNRVHVGTGFLAAPGLVATNRHVLGLLTFGAEALASGTAQIVFSQEKDRGLAPGDIVAIEAVHAVHPTLDMVLLRVADQGRPPLQFEDAAPDEGARVVAIGFPGDDPRNNPLFLSQVFQNGFGVKRAALGEVLDGATPTSLYHDCSTTQGNSGSPVLSLDTGKVSGLHRAGFFMYRNEALVAAELARLVSRELTV